MAYKFEQRLFTAEAVSATSGTATSSAINVSRTDGKFKLSGTMSSTGPNHTIELQYAPCGDGTNAGTYVSIKTALTGNTIILEDFEPPFTPYLFIKVLNTGSADATITLNLIAQERA